MGRWLRGEEKAFDLLYRRHVLTVLQLITQKTGCSQTARDLTQDVFMELYIQKEKLEGVSNVKAYLLSMAKHKVFNYFRQKLVRERYKMSVVREDGQGAHSSIADVLEERELLRIVADKIAALPPKCREVFLLSREEKLSYSAIAHRMSITENTVDQHIRKALRIIRSTLRD